ncbi:dUTPase-like protein, partial [Wolfiporia cocos MD-104 SS10]
VGVNGTLPTRGTGDSIGYDLHAAQDILINSWKSKAIPTDIRIKVPYGTYGRIAPRSGLTKKGIDVLVGVIDHDYRGKVFVLLMNLTGDPYQVKKGDRIA